MMPVMADAAALQFFTEAMRANTAALEGFREEAREDRHMLNDIHTRVVRIETQNVAASVVELSKRVNDLETINDRAVGARTLGNWLVEKTPSIAAMFIAVLATIIIMLKATGRI